MSTTLSSFREEPLSHSILSMEEYLNLVHQSPQVHLRSTAQYFKDIFDCWGQNADRGFKLFQLEHPGSPPIRGQIRTQWDIYKSLCNFTEEGANNKVLLLIGPNGSAKSSLIKKLMLAAQEYSNRDEGALYTFQWVFPLEQFTKGQLGLSQKSERHKYGAQESFAHFEDRDIAAILASELRDHPLLLMPLKQRRELIDQLHQGRPQLHSNIKKTYLYNGDLSQRNRQIYDALLKNSKGDHTQVLRYIRVERFIISKYQSQAAVSIEPQMHIDASIAQLTMDRRLSALPASLQSLNLFQLSGELVMANRGILEYSDLLKRPLDTFKYLLSTMETHLINLHGVVSELDIFFVATSNELHFSAFKQHPDFHSFKGRFHFLKVPYLLNYQEEQLIYQDQVKDLSMHSRFEPHALPLLCLWSVMTRLRRPSVNNYEDKKLGEIFHRMTPLEKTLYLAHQQLPDKFDTKEKQLIKNQVELLDREYEHDGLYEGKFGISPREVKQIIYELCADQEMVTAIDILEYLKKLQERKNDFDFLNMSFQGDYHHPARFIELLEAYLLDQYDREVRNSMGLVDQRSYEDYLEKYILHITALMKGEKLKNSITGKFETCDLHFIREVESQLSLREKPEDFRSHMISRVGAHYLDHPGKEIIYCDIFPDIVQSLQEGFRKEQKRELDLLTKKLVLLLDDMEQQRHRDRDQEELEERWMEHDETQKIFQKISENLQKQYGHSEKGTIIVLKYLIQHRY